MLHLTRIFLDAPRIGAMLMPTTTMFPSGKLIPAYKLERSDVTLYQLLRDYRHIAPGSDGENDTSIDPSPPYSNPIPKVPVACVIATSHRLGSEGIVFRQDLGMMDSKISNFMASILPDALVKPIDLNTSLKNMYGLSHSLTLQMQAGPFKLINHLLSSLHVLTESDVGRVAGHNGSRFGSWYSNLPLESAPYDIDMPNGGFVAIDADHCLDYIYAMDTHSPAHLLSNFNGDVTESAMDRLERWAQEGHKMSNVDFRDVDNLGGLYSIVRRMMLTCTSLSPKLYILSSYTQCLVLRVCPPTAEELRTQVYVSCRYKRSNTAPIDYQPGGITLDVRKVSMTILLLAMSTKHWAEKPESWEVSYVWPTELQIRAWTIEAVVGKDNVGTLRRSSRLSGQAVATGVDLPKEEIPGASKLKLTTYASSSIDAPENEVNSPHCLKGYQINGNSSFRPVRIEKWQNSELLKVHRRRSALPDCLQFDLPKSDRVMRLDFEYFIHRGSLGDIYFGTLHVENLPPTQVAIKVVVPDLYFRASDLPKDEGDVQVTMSDDGDSSMDSQASEVNPSAEEVRSLILNEARNYLICLVDSPAAPGFYGLWQGRSAAPRLPKDDIVYDNLEILLLVTEYLPQSFLPSTATQQDWNDIKERYRQLRGLGIAHEAKPANWRAKDNAWFVIDYAKAEYDIDPPATWGESSDEWHESTMGKCHAAFETVSDMAKAAEMEPKGFGLSNGITSLLASM